MTSFPTLCAALRARAAGDHGITYANGADDQTRVPFADLGHRARAILHHLQRAGATPGTELLLVTERNEAFVDAFWACLQGGIAAVPIALGSADEHRLKFWRVFGRLQRPRVAVERAPWQRLAAFATANGFARELARVERHVVLLDDIAAGADAGTVHDARPDDTALIQFSSGSTSEPKGVCLTHRNLLTNIDAIAAGARATPDDRSLSWMPLTHDMGLIGFHLTPLVADVEHALMPTALFVRRPLLWLQTATRLRATVLSSPNFGYRHYLKAFAAPKATGLDLAAVRVIFNGAEPISAALCAEFLAALAPFGLRDDVMFPVYGLAEASLAVTFPPPGRRLVTVNLERGALGIGDAPAVLPAAAATGAVYVSVGTPVQGCALAVADAAGAALPDGHVGRLLIRGDNVSAGYYGDAAATAAARTADGWLDTGDLGAIVGGELVVTGRVKEILFVGGQNHYPHDLEAVVERHAGIEPGRVAVAGVRAADAATDDVVVFVAVKLAPADFAALARTVRRALNEHTGLAVAAVVPVPRLPKTTSGKIQRYALARDYERGDFAPLLAELDALDAAAASARATVAGAGDGLEGPLLTICRDVLPGRTIGVDDNLFEIGTGSLALAQIFERVEAAWPGRLEVTDFFEYPTVRAMAGFLAARLADD